jgi:hypothetical protein
MEHTPGPWEWSGGLSDSYYRLVAPNADYRERNVLEVVEGTVYSEYSSDSAYIDATPANARLIAAAPDLLDALEEFCGGLFSYPPGSIGDEVLQKAKAAIAKATGAA